MKSQQSTISAKVFESMKHQIPGPLIIDQCKFLEEVYKPNITATIVEGGGAGLKKALNAEDIDYIWSQVEMQNSLRSLSSVIYIMAKTRFKVSNCLSQGLNHSHF